MRRKFFMASAARLFAVGASLASGLTNLKLYGHFFTPDAYGVIVVALQLIGYLPMLDGGFRMATNRRLLASDEGSRQELIVFSQTIYSWLLGLGLATGSLLMMGYALSPHVAAVGGWTWPLFLALAFSGALSMFAGAQSSLLLGLGAQASMCLVSGISALVAVGTLAASLWAGLGLWGFPLSMLASASTMYGLALAFLHFRQQNIPLLRFTLDAEFRRLFRDIAGDAWRAFRSQVSIVLLFSSDIVLASFFCRPSDVAIYGVLSRVLSIARSFLQAFNESAWPFIAARSHGFERFQDWIVRANAWLYGLTGGVLIMVLPGFIKWYMGSAWEPPALLCWLLVVRFLIIGLAGPASYFLLGKGDFGSVAKCTEYELLASVILSLALAPQFGLLGIATGYLLGTSGGTLIPFWVIYARQRAQKLWRLLVGAWLRVAASFCIGFLSGELFLKLLASLPGWSA